MSESHDLLATRRHFLRNGMLGAATAYSVPAFVHNTFTALDASAEGAETQGITGKDAPILVILQLAGGNDGLNTIVPFSDDAYYATRPELALKKDTLLKLNDDLGFSGALPFLKGRFDDGNLAIIQGVGYPNPNRSHFRSTEIWQTATDADGVSTTGWLGRYFDSCCKGADPDPNVGVSISKKQPQSFSAKKNPGISLSAPEMYRWIRGGKPDELAEEIFDDFNQPDEEMEASSGGSVFRDQRERWGTRRGKYPGLPRANGAGCAGQFGQDPGDRQKAQESHALSGFPPGQQFKLGGQDDRRRTQHACLLCQPRRI